MFTFPDTLIIYLNFAFIVWFLISLARGYKRGLLLQIVDLAGTFVALFAAWVFAPVFVRLFEFVKAPGSGMISIDQIVTLQVNRLIWFLILFVAARLLLLLVTPLVSVVSKIPLVKQVNSVVGAVFSIILFGVKMLLLAYFLTFPFVSNGQSIIDHTVLKPLVEVTSPILENFDVNIEENEALQSLMSNRKLTANQEKVIADWLSEKGVNELDIKEFLNKDGQ